LVLRERRRINHKRVYRLYTKLGLAVRRKKAEAGRTGESAPANRSDTSQ
jgi:hypothetical protein